MARNGSGTFALLATVAPANTVSSSTTVNSVMDDIATGLTDSINKAGTKAFEANQSAGGNKFTSLGDGSARTDSHNIGQAQDGKLNWVASGGTADAITATYSPAITALVDGQECCFRASGANTVTTPTFAPNGLTARTITKTGGSALLVGDIAGAGHEVILRYLLASTRWEILNPAASTAASPASTTEQLTGTSTSVRSTPDSVAALWEKGSDVASATTTAFGEGGYVHITGTTTITDLDFTTAKDGRGVKVQFDGILTLTHNSTTLVLPGGASITTAAGDTAEFVQDSSDNIKCLWYQRASGRPVIRSVERAVVVKTSGTTYTTPAGCTQISVEVIGGGAGGADGTTPGGGGGGGGGYARKLYTVTASTGYTYAVGAAGTRAGNGGDSTFTDGSTIITGSGGVTGSGAVGGNGGTGTNGDLNLSGGKGGRGTNVGVNIDVGGGGGAAGFGMGAGGAGGAEAGGTGTAGASYGGGGGGGGDSGNGAVGAAGAVIITEYY